MEKFCEESADERDRSGRWSGWRPLFHHGRSRQPGWGLPHRLWGEQAGRPSCERYHGERSGRGCAALSAAAVGLVAVCTQPEIASAREPVAAGTAGRGIRRRRRPGEPASAGADSRHRLSGGSRRQQGCQNAAAAAGRQQAGSACPGGVLAGRAWLQGGRAAAGQGSERSRRFGAAQSLRSSYGVPAFSRPRCQPCDVCWATRIFLPHGGLRLVLRAGPRSRQNGWTCCGIRIRR